MNKVCGTCGYAGENTWRDGKYYCAMCGSEIDVTTPTPKQNLIAATCPICKNDKDNVLRNGRCYCAMCGTEFDYAPPVSYNNVYTPPVPQYDQVVGYQNMNYRNYNAARRMELENEKSHRMTWGIVWLILCWPVGVYHFYKWSKANNELKKLL